ncbi:hypothetical protein FD755_011504 [Muntiacus reevesi]|uniref:Interleukin-19 n=1 Tax=Muntiacus reevesi TaxID=9886 RepID=A0A5N3XSZ7_MUNRE|nr:hypothetical protein FD755_011504 [Muntiacus reevesi]
MKAPCVSLCLLGAGLFLCSAHARGLRRCLISMNLHRVEESFRGIKTAIQAKDTFQNVTILSPSETLHGTQPLDVCCVTKNLLAFYVDRVFKDHQELSPQIMRKISSLANSFLYMQKTLQQCVRPAGPMWPSEMVLMDAISILSQQKLWAATSNAVGHLLLTAGPLGDCGFQGEWQ